MHFFFRPLQLPPLPNTPSLSSPQHRPTANNGGSSGSSGGSSNNSPNSGVGNNSSSNQRNKFVTFTVDLQRDLGDGPLGLTLATEEDANVPGPIFISALMEDGLAERTKTIQSNN